MTPFCPHNNKRDPYLTRVRSQLVCLFMSEKEITSTGRMRRRSSNSSVQTNLSWDHFYETLRPVLMEMLFVSADASKFPLLWHKWWWWCSLDWLTHEWMAIIKLPPSRKSADLVQIEMLSGQERESLIAIVNKMMTQASTQSLVRP